MVNLRVNILNLLDIIIFSSLPCGSEQLVLKLRLIPVITRVVLLPNMVSHMTQCQLTMRTCL